ncbi:hypothetical protein LOD99_13563 [Oopsacas minuta]|uniref:PDZ domain-containing protein n=1 Tax=Oopsacas minuta TaxID=111878 RepID=A0AAV7KI70_9METZ|nr:hypothetical protein LOD99_13563 [Oopsacas minuta]
MATAIDTHMHPDIERLRVLVTDKKEEVKKQFDMLRTNLSRKERSIYVQLDDIVTAAYNSHRGLLRSIEQLEIGRASLENIFKENLVLNLLDKTVVDLEREKNKLEEQDAKIPKIVHLLWNLEPFVRELDTLCVVRLSSNSQFDKKVINLRRREGQSFGFVLMSDINKQTTICRINEDSPAHNSELRIGDILLLIIAQMNTGKTTLLGWCLLTLAGGGALFVTRREYLASKQRHKNDAYISDKNITWQDILTYEEKKIKFEEEQKEKNQPPPTDGKT